MYNNRETMYNNDKRQYTNHVMNTCMVHIVKKNMMQIVKI